MLKVETEVILGACCVCGIPIAMTRLIETELRRTHGTFWCVVGHSQAWLAKTEAERLREELTIAQERCNALSTQKTKLEAQVKQAQEGNCPLCDKRVDHLARHMSRKHRA